MQHVAELSAGLVCERRVLLDRVFVREVVRIAMDEHLFERWLPAAAGFYFHDGVSHTEWGYGWVLEALPLNLLSAKGDIISGSEFDLSCVLCPYFFGCQCRVWMDLSLIVEGGQIASWV